MFGNIIGVRYRSSYEFVSRALNQQETVEASSAARISGRYYYVCNICAAFIYIYMYVCASLA